MTVLSGVCHKTAVCLAFVGILSSGSAWGACLSPGHVARVLAKLGEYPRYTASYGGVRKPVRLYLNPTKKTWTLVAYDGRCAYPLMSGHNWRPAGQRAER